MTAHQHLRGHPIIYVDGHWKYEDTGEIADYERPCTRCGEMPTKEGYDHCLGYIKGAKHACCGHGKEKAYTKY